MSLTACGHVQFAQFHYHPAIDLIKQAAAAVDTAAETTATSVPTNPTNVGSSSLTPAESPNRQLYSLLCAALEACTSAELKWGFSFLGDAHGGQGSVTTRAHIHCTLVS